MFSSLLGLALLSIALPSLATSHHGAPHRRHEAIVAAHQDAHNVTAERSLDRRGQVFNNARLTYYDVGLGACGKYNVPSDFIVALNSAQYGGGYPGPQCFKQIEITYQGKTERATVMDECPGCPYAGLDLSRGLFQSLDSLDKGVLTASWRFVDGSDSGDDQPEPKPTSSSTTHKPTSTEQPKPKPTSTEEKPKPTSTEEKPKTTEKTTSSSTTEKTTTSTRTSTSTSTSTSTTSTSSTSKSIAQLVTTSSSKSVPPSTTSTSTASPTPTGPNTLEKLEQAIIGLTGLMFAAGAV